MEKKIPVKSLYLLLVIGIGLISLAVGSTYALFTTSAEISNPISLNSNLTHTSDIIETIEVEVPAGELVTSTLNVTNSSGTALNYTAWYLDEGYDIVIGSDGNAAAGMIDNGSSTSVTVKILNNSNVTINVTLGVSSSSGGIVLGNGMVALGKFRIEPAMLAEQNTWYTGSTDKTTITKIIFAEEYTVTGNETESWPAAVDADEDGVNDDDIMCYLNGTELTIVGNGSDEIYLNTDGNVTFYNFNKLTSIENISMLNTSKTVTMYSLFSECNVLTELDLSSFDTSNVTSMHAMFYHCYALTELDLSGFDTTKVTNMASMFDVCRNLTTLDVSAFDTSNVENMTHMFNGCHNLTYINMSGFDTSKVTNMFGMFNDCQKLSTLDISTFDTSNVTDTGHMFSYCHKLTTIYVSDLWTTANVTSSTDMFINSTSLVGGAGTTFSSSYIDKTYARVDGGTSKPGYLTGKTREGKWFDGVNDYYSAGFANTDFGKSVSLGIRFKLNSIPIITEVDLIDNFEGGGFGIILNSNVLKFNVYSTSSSSYLFVASSLSPEVGDWHTAVVTYDGNIINLYVDGSLNSYESFTDNLKISTASFVIGANAYNNVGNGNWFDGVISHAFLTSDVLTASEISANFTDEFNYTNDSNTYFYYDFRT